MKFIYVLFLAGLISLNTSAQNSLSGKVTNKVGDPIAADIYLPQLEKGGITDLDGSYSIRNLPIGTYNIIYSSLGYATQSTKVTFGEIEDHTLNIVLEESAVEMEAVIISTPFHQLQRDNIMKVERISTESLITTGALNLSQAISNIPGVSTISTGSGIGKPVIRGLSSNRVLTYAQGVRLENQQFGDEHGLGINGAGIESIEVIKGPASLLYGSDALGGVLYINPESFAPTENFEMDASTFYFSNTHGTNNSLGVRSSGKKFKYLLRGTYGSFTDYRTGDATLVTNTRYNEFDLKAGMRFQNSKWKSTVRYNYNRSNIGIPDGIDEQSTSRKLLSPFQEIDNHILSFDNSIFFNKSSLLIKAGYIFNDRREIENEDTGKQEQMGPSGILALRLKLNTFNYDIKYNLPEFGKFETIIGVQGLFQKNKNFGQEILIPDANKRDFGIFATSHYHLEKTDFQAGVRLDLSSITSEAARDPLEFNFIPELDRSFISFSAALGAKIDFTENFLTRINLASGFRTPNLAELTSNGVHEGTNRYELGNPNLKNEQNIQTDISLEYRDEHFEIIANGFYNTISDYIFISPSNVFIEEDMVFNYVQSDARLYGGELGLHLHPHPLDWLHLKSSFETVTGVLEDGEDLPLIPANTIRNTMRVELKDGKKLKKSFAFITLQNTLNQNKVSQFETTTKGYNLLSTGVGSHVIFNKIWLDVGLNITNLTNETYVAHLSRLKTEGIPNPGRSYNLNLKLEL
jgi:iron complex outermembrane recepter protein